MWQKQLTNIEVAGSQSGFPKKPFSPSKFPEQILSLQQFHGRTPV
jgi:hypothetical protein